MSNENFGPLSLIPGLGLEGYADEVAVPGGGTIHFMLSGPRKHAQIEVLRLIQGDPNPAGPGVKREVLPWAENRDIAISRQDVDYGSYLEIPHRDKLNPVDSFTVAFWYYPTFLRQGWNALVAKWLPDQIAYGIFAVEKTLVAGVSHDGRQVEWVTAMETVSLGCWQFVAFAFDASSGNALFYQHFRGGGAGERKRWTPDVEAATWSERLQSGPLFNSTAPLLWGAVYADDGAHTAHLNGKIGHPVIFGEALTIEALHALRSGSDPEQLGTVLGCWDLSQDVQSARVVDVSGNEHHGRAVNAPGRAVTGPGWDEREWYVREGSYSREPSHYNAIHLHEDDLEDAGWNKTVSIDVPPDARSGVYAAKITTDGPPSDELFLPFVVRSRTPTADIGCLIPTLTWLAYSTNRSPYSYTRDGVLDRGLAQYNTHRDGSLPFYVTRLRPTRTGHPSLGFERQGAHKITSNLYLLDWLERTSFPYEAFVDENLHDEGADLLRKFRCVILGSHPEYWTSAMLDALVSYLEDGGRVLYLGGNGLYWVTSLDPSRPHLMEVRKEEGGDYNPTVYRARGESEHSTTLEAGGAWPLRGRPPEGIVGVGYAANVWIPGTGRFGFVRAPISFEEPYRFVFDGVDEELIGSFGLNLGSAAANELDSARLYDYIGRPAPVVLARASHPLYFSADPELPLGDITLLEYAGGGAVFAAGSVTWTGSLAHNNYDNSVARITENVIRRFIATPPRRPVLERPDR